MDALSLALSSSVVSLYACVKQFHYFVFFNAITIIPKITIITIILLTTKHSRTPQQCQQLGRGMRLSLAT